MPQLQPHSGSGNQLSDPDHNILHNFSNTDIIRFLELDVDIGKISNEAAACADLVPNDHVFNQQPGDVNSYATVVTSVDNVSDEESSSSFTELTPLQDSLTPLQVSQTSIIPGSQFYANPSPPQKQARRGNLTEPTIYDSMTPGQTTPVSNGNSVTESISYVNLAPVHVSGTNGASDTISYINLMPVQTQVLSRSQSPHYANTNSTTAVPPTTYTTPMALSTEAPATYTITEDPTVYTITEDPTVYTITEDPTVYTLTEAPTRPMYTIPMPVSLTTTAPNTYAIGAAVDIGPPEAMDEDAGVITATPTYVCLGGGFPTTRAEEAFDVTTASGCESVSYQSSSDFDLDSLPATPDQNKARRAPRTRHTTASSDDSNKLKRVRKRKPRERKPKLYEMQLPLKDPMAEKKRQDAINAKKNRDKKKRTMDDLKAQVNEAIQEKLALQRELEELAKRERNLRAQIYENKAISSHSIGVGTR